ncbi:MAG TPA: metal-dependent hydrolase [Bacillales bacterium]
MILAALMHVLAGANISYLICSVKRKFKKRILLLCMGGLAGISPDITKYFGDLFGHSVWAVPIFGLLIALIAKLFIKDTSLKKLWLAFSLSVLFGHIFIDLISNGIALFYPWLRGEIGFHIIGKLDVIIFFIMMVTITIVIVSYSKGKVSAIIGMLLIATYIGVLTYSKIQLYQTLIDQYEKDKIKIIATYPSKVFMWDFQVETSRYFIRGNAPIFSDSIDITDKWKKK